MLFTEKTPPLEQNSYLYKKEADRQSPASAGLVLPVVTGTAQTWTLGSTMQIFQNTPEL